MMISARGWTSSTRRWMRSKSGRTVGLMASRYVCTASSITPSSRVVPAGRGVDPPSRAPGGGRRHEDAPSGSELEDQVERRFGRSPDAGEPGLVGDLAQLGLTG